MTWAQARRGDFISWRLAYHGTLRREHIKATFGVSTVQASTDIRDFLTAHPGAMHYDPKRKEYVANGKKPARDIEVDGAGRLVFTIG